VLPDGLGQRAGIPGHERRLGPDPDRLLEPAQGAAQGRGIARRRRNPELRQQVPHDPQELELLRVLGRVGDLALPDGLGVVHGDVVEQVNGPLRGLVPTLCGLASRQDQQEGAQEETAGSEAVQRKPQRRPGGLMKSIFVF
jgi:hypothetical protein